MVKRKWLKIKIPATIITVTTSLLFISAAAVLASSGGEGDGGWAITDTYRVMNFSVLAIALFFLLRKPVSQFLSERIQGIQTQLAELEAKKTEAEKKLAEYNKKLESLDAEADEIIARYKKQGEDLKAKILEEAEAAAEKLEEQAHRNIDQEFKVARKQLESEVLERAIEKAEAKLKKNITDQDQDRLVEEYLTKVVTK